MKKKSAISLKYWQQHLTCTLSEVLYTKIKVCPPYNDFLYNNLRTVKLRLDMIVYSKLSSWDRRTELKTIPIRNMIENTNAINWWNTVFTHWHLINVHIFYSLQMYWTASLFWQALQILQSVNGRTRIRFDSIFFLCYKIQNSCCNINGMILRALTIQTILQKFLFFKNDLIFYFLFSK